MEPIFSCRFEASPGIAVLDGVAADWQEIIVRGNVLASATNAHILLRPTIDSGVTWIASGFKTHIIQESQPNNFVASGNSSWAGMVSGGSATPDRCIDFEYRLFQPNDGGAEKHFYSSAIATNYAANLYSNDIRGNFACQIINGLKLLPNTGTISGWVEVLGVRGHDIYPEPEDIFRFACVGASLTYGGKWIEPVRQGLASAWPGKTVIGRNLAQPNYGSRRALENIGNIIASKADAVIIEFAAADAHTGNSTSLSECCSLTGQIIAAIEAGLPDADIYLMTMNPVIATTNFPNLASYYQKYRDMAVGGIGLIDVNAAWGTPTSAQMPDGVHPTPAAHAAITVPTIVDALT